MNDITFPLVVFLTICALLFGLYLIWQHIQDRKPKPNPILGYVNDITMTDRGLEVRGMFTEEGKRLHDLNKITGMSLGVNSPKPATYVNGVRVIQDARLHSVSVDTEPGPYGGRIDWVGEKPPRDMQPQDTFNGGMIEFVDKEPKPN